MTSSVRRLLKRRHTGAFVSNPATRCKLGRSAAGWLGPEERRGSAQRSTKGIIPKVAATQTV
jgi:hypothetical protein